VDAWLGDLEIMHEDIIDDLSDNEFDKLRQRTSALRRVMLILDFKADVAEELVSSISGAEKRLVTAEREVADLRSQLETANAEIAKLRATERSVEEVPEEGLESVSGRLLRTMERLERRVSEHVQTCSERQPNTFERSFTPRGADVGGPASEDARKAEPSRPNNGGADAEPWSVVVGGRARRGPGFKARSSRPQRTSVDSTLVGANRRAEPSMYGVGRVPRSPVVHIKSLKKDVPESVILRRVRDGVSLGDFGIKSARFREAISGGVLMEVLDPDVKLDRVDALVGAIDSVVSECAKVYRPARRVEFRLRGFDPSTTMDELRESVAKAGGCAVSAVTISGIRRLNSGHRVAWANCPANVARLVVEGKCLKVGWSSVSVDSARVRKIQCYRCWQYGHVRGACKAALDRAGCCFRCGEAGHLAGKCENALSCVLCRDRGMDHAHRLGSSPCKSADLPSMCGRT